MDSQQRYSGLLGDGGPSDASLLKRQGQHRSQEVWNTEIQSNTSDIIHNALTIHRRRWKQSVIVNEAFMRYMQAACFWDVWCIGHVVVEAATITALVERWRPETHTFHMPGGEMSITLQDVSVLLGLPIDGLPLTGRQTPLQWKLLCEQLLGRNPAETPGMAVRNQIAMRWLDDNFDPAALPVDADDEVVQQYVRANILRVIGSVLFPETTESRVSACWLPMLVDLEEISTFSWGSACLAHLYSQLCRATDVEAKTISGAISLVSMWVAERIIPLRPVVIDQKVQAHGQALGIRWSGAIDRSITKKITSVAFYRRKLDELRDSDVIWMPYTDEIMIKLPDICHRDRVMWLARLPLISFSDVEWHYPDRVLRQFGYLQGIPLSPEIDEGSHGAMSGRGHAETKWDKVYSGYVRLWTELRHTFVLPGGLPSSPYIHYHDGYMDWYRAHSRRFISPAGAMLQRNADAVERIRHSYAEDPQLLKWSEAALEMVGEQRRYTDLPDSQQPPTQAEIMHYDIPALEGIQYTRGKASLFGKRKPLVRGQPVPEFVVQPMEWSDYHLMSQVPSHTPSTSLGGEPSASQPFDRPASYPFDAPAYRPVFDENTHTTQRVPDNFPAIAPQTEPQSTGWFPPTTSHWQSPSLPCIFVHTRSRYYEPSASHSEPPQGSSPIQRVILPSTTGGSSEFDESEENEGQERGLPQCHQLDRAAKKAAPKSFSGQTLKVPGKDMWRLDQAKKDAERRKKK